MPVVKENDAADFRVLCACRQEHAILCIVNDEIDELRSRPVDPDTLAASLIAGIATRKERTHWIRVRNFEIAIDHIGTVHRQHVTVRATISPSRMNDNGVPLYPRGSW